MLTSFGVFTTYKHNRSYTIVFVRNLVKLTSLFAVLWEIIRQSCTLLTVKFPKLVRYNHEILLIKYAKSNQVTHFVH
jgi:hypothetical protein